MDDGTTVLALADASKQTLLDSEVIVDPMETEQLGVEIDCQGYSY
jgi:hypothetical protein